MTQYQERLYWHIRRMTHVHQDADDVLQNTFIKVFRNIGNFQGNAKLYTWLYRIATNECITFLKSRNRRATSAIDNNDHSLEHQLKADSYWDGDRAQLLLQLAMDTLPEKQKAVFLLRYYDNMPYKEMEKVLDTSIGALKASYHHAVKKIEHYIKHSDR